MCEKQEIDSRIMAGMWTCEDCGSLVAHDVEICAICEGVADDMTEYYRDLQLERQELDDFCECDESYGFYDDYDGLDYDFGYEG